jgi:hypothetical protein
VLRLRQVLLLDFGPGTTCVHRFRATAIIVVTFVPLWCWFVRLWQFGRSEGAVEIAVHMGTGPYAMVVMICTVWLPSDLVGWLVVACLSCHGWRAGRPAEDGCAQA